MNCHRIVFAISIVIFCLISDTALGREIVRSGANAAHVSDSFKCSQNIELIIKAQERSFFTGQNIELQRLVGSARAILGFECSNISTIRVVGIAGKSRVYDGYSKKDQRWRLVQGKLQQPKPVIRKTASFSGEKKIGFPKVWESKTIEHSKQIGPYTVWVKKYGATPQNKTFMAHVMLQKKLRVGFPNLPYSSCDPIIIVDINAFGNSFNYDRFLNDRKGKNLPPEIIDGLYLMRDLLLEQCDELKAMRFKFYSNVRGKNNIQYTGTISSDKGWAIQEGIARTSFDHMKKIKLVYRDQFAPVNPAGIVYEGTCEKNPVLPLIQVHKTEPTKPWTGDLVVDIFDFKRAAKTVARIYQSQCPNVETISFTINPVPDEYACKDKEPCYLTWSKQDPKEVVSQYKYFEKPRLNDYNDVMNAFIEGNYQLLDQYTGYVRFFHNDFIEVYSDFCNKYMTERVAMDITPIETRYDSDGFIESQKQIAPTYRIYIDPRYLNRYQSFEVPNRAWAVNRMLRISTNKNSITETVRSVQRGVGMFIGDRNLIKNFLYDNKCKGKKTEVVYENLDRYFKRKPPIGVDGKIIESALPALKTSSVPPPAEIQTTPSDIAVDVAIGSWKAVVDNQPIELVLWPVSQNNKTLKGYFYIPRHDCVMPASLVKDMDQSAARYGKLGDLALRAGSYFAKDRKNNCALNTSDLNGRYKNTFQAGGYLTVDEKIDGLNFETTGFYLGKCIACSKSKTAPKKMDIKFRKAPVSSEMLNIINTFESSFSGKPDPGFLSEIQ